MKQFLTILSLVVSWPVSPSWAQLEPPNAMGVTMGHLHLNVQQDTPQELCERRTG